MKFFDPIALWLGAMADIVQRAFELAREGKCQNIRHLEVALIKEGFDEVRMHLSGVFIRKQIYAIMKKH